MPNLGIAVLQILLALLFQPRRLSAELHAAIKRIEKICWSASLSHGVANAEIAPLA